MAFSTYLSPADCVRDDDKLWETLNSLVPTDEWFQGSPQIPLERSGVSDLETSHIVGARSRILDLDVTLGSEDEVEMARSRLLQGVQRVLRSLRRSARINRRNWRRTGRLREILRERMAAANGTEVKEPPMVLSGKEHPQARAVNRLWDLQVSQKDKSSWIVVQHKTSVPSGTQTWPLEIPYTCAFQWGHHLKNIIFPDIQGRVL